MRYMPTPSLPSPTAYSVSNTMQMPWQFFTSVENSMASSYLPSPSMSTRLSSGPRSCETISRPRLPQVMLISEPVSSGSAMRSMRKPGGSVYRSRYDSVVGASRSFHGLSACTASSLAGVQAAASKSRFNQPSPSGAVRVATHVELVTTSTKYPSSTRCRGCINPPEMYSPAEPPSFLACTQNTLVPESTCPARFTL